VLTVVHSFPIWKLFMDDCWLLKELRRPNIALCGVWKDCTISKTLFVNLLLEAEGNPFKVKNLVNIIFWRACSLIQELYPTLLRELDNYVGIMGSHRNLMIKKVVGCYIALRVKQFCKQLNKQSVKVRVQLSKLILFKHQ
jgi:hypothetical protein